MQKVFRRNEPASCHLCAAPARGVDNPRRDSLPTRMPALRRLIALAVLAVWLPATLHCALEAAGFEGVFSCADGHETGAHDESPRDACDVVEGAAFKPAANTAALTPPVPCACLPCFVAPLSAIDLTPPATGVSEFVAAPPEVARTWHFVARAAPSPRAPALSLV